MDNYMFLSPSLLRSCLKIPTWPIRLQARGCLARALGTPGILKRFLKELPAVLALATVLTACAEQTQPPITQQPSSSQTALVEPAQIDPAAAKAFKQGLFYLQAKNYATAENALRQALAVNGDVAVYHHHLGLALQSLGRYDEAAAEYQTAIDLDPSSPNPPIALGRYAL